MSYWDAFCKLFGAWCIGGYVAAAMGANINPWLLLVGVAVALLVAPLQQRFPR